jgi:type IV fimbrial biogenesis protein FimT
MKTSSISISGFTAIELMTTVTVMAVIVAVAVPALKESVRTNRLASSANEFVSTLSLARSEAVKRGMRVTIRKTAANWENGWQIFTDNPDAKGNYGILDGEDTVLHVYGALPTNYILRGNNNFINYISFLSTGESNQPGSFAICENTIGNGRPQRGNSRLIIVNTVGRVRQGIDSNKNGIPEGDPGVDLASCVKP